MIFERPDHLKNLLKAFKAFVEPSKPTNYKRHNGLFIVVDGPDGAGKTTVMNSLQRHFPKFHFTREVGGTMSGEAMRKVLLLEDMSADAQMLIATAARLEHNDELKARLRNSNTVVICDRYYYSTIAYQCAAGGASYAVEESLRKFYDFVEPDLVIFLDPSDHGYERILERPVTDIFEDQDQSFHRATVANYRAQFAHLNCQKERIDTTISIEHTLESVTKAVKRAVALHNPNGYTNP